MRTKDNLTLRKIGNKYMIVDTFAEEVNMVDVYTMNETAALLWRTFAKRDFTQEEMVNVLCKEYEVTQERATDDVEKLIKDWFSYGLIYND